MKEYASKHNMDIGIDIEIYGLVKGLIEEYALNQNKDPCMI